MKITPLKMWVQNVLPVVYDDSLSYYEMVGKINEKTNEIIAQVNENTDGIEALNEVIQQLGNIDELRALLEEVETIVNDLYTTDTPLMDSANGSAGTAEHAARSDHSHPKDSSKADTNLGMTTASAGQYVRIKTADFGSPTAYEGATPHEIPIGGNTGDVLLKSSSADYAAQFARLPGCFDQVANVYTTATSPRLIYANEFLFWQGYLYQAKVNIPQGASFDISSSGNLTPAKITSGFTYLRVFVSITIQSIVAGTSKEGTATFTQPPAGYGLLAIIPQYTNNALPIVSCWNGSAFDVHAVVHNLTASAVDSTATVMLLFARGTTSRVDE